MEKDEEVQQALDLEKAVIEAIFEGFLKKIEKIKKSPKDNNRNS